MKDNELKILALHKPTTVGASTAEGTRRPYAKPIHHRQAPTAAAGNTRVTNDGQFGSS